jgi:hypothetical protein
MSHIDEFSDEDDDLIEQTLIELEEYFCYIEEIYEDVFQITVIEK